MIVSMSRRSSLLTQIQNKPVHTSQTKKWNTNNSLSIDQEIEYPSCHDVTSFSTCFGPHLERHK